jgi:hypothetical protein
MDIIKIDVSILENIDDQPEDVCIEAININGPLAMQLNTLKC